jgi:RNA polymerase-binding transcription factor DksA
MTKSQLKHFKDLLNEELELLTEELSSIAHQNNYGDWQVTPEIQEDGAEADENAQADVVEDFESKVGRLEVLEKRYNQITAALLRIENNNYGICLKSGKKIEEDRLEANPAAETCKAMMNTR